MLAQIQAHEAIEPVYPEIYPLGVGRLLYAGAAMAIPSIATATATTDLGAAAAAVSARNSLQRRQPGALMQHLIRPRQWRRRRPLPRETTKQRPMAIVGVSEMRPTFKALVPWLILAAIWSISYIVTGSVSFATMIAGIILFVALMGLLYT